MEFVKSVDTIMFLKQYQQLLGEGAFKNQKEFCEKLKYSSTSFNQILKGTRNIPNHIYVKFCKLFSQEFPKIFKEQQEDQQLSPKNTNDMISRDHPVFKMMQQLIDTNERLSNAVLNLSGKGGGSELSSKAQSHAKTGS